MTDLRALLAAATPRPWTLEPHDSDMGDYTGMVNSGAMRVANVYDCAENAALIVALANAAVELVAVTEAARHTSMLARAAEYRGLGVGPLSAALAALDARLAEENK